jgi:hypothetical protein
MLIYLDDYRDRRIARAAAAEAKATVCAGISMQEIHATASVFSLRKPSRLTSEKVLEHALDRICALATRF